MFKNFSARLGRALLYTYLRVFYRPKIYYESDEARRAVKEGSRVIIANHVGHNDGQMFYMLFHNSTLLIAKDWADKKLLRWLTTGGRFVSVDRFGMDIAWVSKTKEFMAEGNNAIIFPEGKTSKGEMGEFKPGFAILSVMTKADVIPVYNDGEYHKLFGRRLRLYVGNPVSLTEENKGLREDYLKSESERFKNIILNIKKERKKW